MKETQPNKENVELSLHSCYPRAFGRSLIFGSSIISEDAMMANTAKALLSEEKEEKHV
jgi:hypothetical protein